MNRFYQESFWILWISVLGALALFSFVVAPALKHLSEHVFNFLR